jgi:4-amino-4-deoxy-L-arabinose transferase-like glycosyltransferase
MLIPARTGAGAADSSERAPWPPRIEAETLVLAGVTILAAVLRFATITHQSYWLDESQAAHELHLSFGAMLGAWNASEWNPPLYFVLAWPWAKLFGTGEAGLRSFSALLGVAVVPITYLCGRELVSRRAGLVAAAFAAVNPFMIWYSQEAREYMLLVALSGLSVLFFARAVKHASARNLALWAVASGLALLTQYFAAFLIAAEALALLYHARSRSTAAAIGALAVIEVALIPHAIPNLTRTAPWIVGVPLSLRIQQVPVAFGMNTLYLGPAVSYGLIGAAVLAAIVIALLVIGGEDRELRGAGLAGALAGAVLLTPILFALLHHDDYIARGLVPGWIPLAVLIGAACTAARARLAGAALAVVLLALFLYTGSQINDQARYQRPDWRGVAAALGQATGTRAIVAYDGQFASGPLSFYLSGVPWSGPGERPATQAPVSVDELDIVGSVFQRLAKLPAGARLIGSSSVDGYRVVRVGLANPWNLGRAAIGSRASAILGPAPPGIAVMIQRASAALPSA